MDLEKTFPIRSEVEDPRPWTEFAEAARRIGHPAPEHGPWEDEPDKVGWLDKRTGWPCMARRAPSGGWCGYVCVPRTHPLHGHGHSGLDWDDATQTQPITVHGGLTFADSMFSEGDWWFGFDCGHAGDLTPGMPIFGPNGDVYRTLDYVRRQVTSLAFQLLKWQNR